MATCSCGRSTLQRSLDDPIVFLVGVDDHRIVAASAEIRMFWKTPRVCSPGAARQGACRRMDHRPGLLAVREGVEGRRDWSAVSRARATRSATKTTPPAAKGPMGAGPARVRGPATLPPFRRHRLGPILRPLRRPTRACLARDASQARDFQRAATRATALVPQNEDVVEELRRPSGRCRVSPDRVAASCRRVGSVQPLHPLRGALQELGALGDRQDRVHSLHRLKADHALALTTFARFEHPLQFLDHVFWRGRFQRIDADRLIAVSIPRQKRRRPRRRPDARPRCPGLVSGFWPGSIPDARRVGRGSSPPPSRTAAADT